MTLDETRTLLTEATKHDSRITLNDTVVTDWQRCLTRHTFEHCFDAVFDHFDECGPRIPLVPAEVLHHLKKRREARELEERRARDLERNETIFGAYIDRRQPWEIDAAREAAKAGRAHVNEVLAQRKAAS